MEKMLDGFNKKIIPIHTHSLSTPFRRPCYSLFLGRDHLRSNLGIVCGPGSFAVLGSFADSYSTLKMAGMYIVYVIESAAYGVIFTSCLCQSPNERVRAFDTNNE